MLFLTRINWVSQAVFPLGPDPIIPSDETITAQKAQLWPGVILVYSKLNKSRQMVDCCVPRALQFFIEIISCENVEAGGSTLLSCDWTKAKDERHHLCSVELRGTSRRDSSFHGSIPQQLSWKTTTKTRKEGQSEQIEVMKMGGQVDKSSIF